MRACVAVRLGLKKKPKPKKLSALCLSLNCARPLKSTDSLYHRLDRKFSLSFFLNCSHLLSLNLWRFFNICSSFCSTPLPPISALLYLSLRTVKPCAEAKYITTAASESGSGEVTEIFNRRKFHVLIGDSD